MNKLNTTLVFIAPFFIYLLSVWGSYQALIGIVAYTFWLMGNLDESHFVTKKRHDRRQA
ncbi:hypothetical protein IGI57_002521 [Enterococcus sp. DIV0213j]|jgi:hypothetical protein|uniref:hypothetical protein n=1 Tax=Enterococcus sp. DIV0213j TaxID=2774649 RepID=UPI003D294FBC